MQVTSEQIDPCKVALTITVEGERVEGARKKAFASALQSIQLPGFRKGKVPPHMARNYVDPTRVRQRTVELIVPDAYRDAVSEAAIEPFGQAEFELVDYPEDGSLVFKANVPLRPVVTLGEYKGLEVERRRLVVTDAEVDQQVEALRTRQAKYDAVADAVAAIGDMVLVDLTAVVEGRDLPELAEPKSTLIEVGKNIPDLDNGLVGIVAGDDKTIEALYPGTFQDPSLRGKKATFTVSVKEVRKRALPEVDDAFAASVHPTATTVDALRAALKDSLETAADEMADNELEVRLVSRIVESAQIHFPEVLLRAEVEAEARQLEERLKEQNVTVEDYLRAIGKSTDEVLGEMSVGASQRIRNSLVLSEVAKTEAITVDDADIDAKIAQRAAQANVSPAAVRAFAEKNNQLDRYRDQALTEKILAHLKSLSTVVSRSVSADELRGESAAPATTEAAEKPKARRSTKKSEPAAETPTEAPAEVPVVAAAPKRRKKAADAAD
ncbi:MAG: trigger factor [Armatimonadota bacterium]